VGVGWSRRRAERRFRAQAWGNPAESWFQKAIGIEILREQEDITENELQLPLLNWPPCLPPIS